MLPEEVGQTLYRSCGADADAAVVSMQFTVALYILGGSPEPRASEKSVDEDALFIVSLTGLADQDARALLHAAGEDSKLALAAMKEAASALELRSRLVPLLSQNQDQETKHGCEPTWLLDQSPAAPGPRHSDGAAHESDDPLNSFPVLVLEEGGSRELEDGHEGDPRHEGGHSQEGGQGYEEGSEGGHHSDLTLPVSISGL